MTSNLVLSNVEYDVVGKRPIRHDGVDKVTGKATYGGDVKVPGQVRGKILRSPTLTPRLSPSTPAPPRPTPA